MRGGAPKLGASASQQCNSTFSVEVERRRGSSSLWPPGPLHLAANCVLGFRLSEVQPVAKELWCLYPVIFALGELTHTIPEERLVGVVPSPRPLPPYGTLRGGSYTAPV